LKQGLLFNERGLTTAGHSPSLEYLYGGYLDCDSL
jgi:hypothetical protein